MTNLPSICIEVDELTPCLRDLTTGKLVQTSFDKITISEQVAQELRKGGWLFDWADVADFTVVKLHIVGSDLIQGLVAYHNEKGYVKLDLAESAPYNRGRNKQYSGVGGNLFAIAAKASFDAGDDGFVLFRPKTNLRAYYSRVMGAKDITMGNQYLDKSASARLIRIYLKGDLRNDEEI